MNDSFNDGQPMSLQMPLPNSTAVLVLGILSIPTCCCYGVGGLILAIIAVILAKGANQAYLLNPESYTESSYKNLKAGKICAWVGLALAILAIAYIIFVIAFVGFESLSNPEKMQEILENMRN
jgi:hypothetical protein